MVDRPPIIDADGHIQERAEDIRKYLESPWDRRPSGLTPGDQPWDRDIFGKISRYPGYTRDLLPAQRRANLKSCGNWAPAGARVKERRTLPAQHKTPDGEMNWRDTPWREDTTAQRRSRPRRPSTPPWKPSFAKEPAGCSPPPSRRRSARFWAEPAMSGASPSAATATGTSRSAS